MVEINPGDIVAQHPQDAVIYRFPSAGAWAVVTSRPAHLAATLTIEPTGAGHRIRGGVNGAQYTLGDGTSTVEIRITSKGLFEHVRIVSKDTAGASVIGYTPEKAPIYGAYELSEVRLGAVAIKRASGRVEYVASQP